MEKEVEIRRETKGQKHKEEILDQPKDKVGTWKARTGLSPGKWATRSLRRSKEEMVPLQRRGSLRGSLRFGKRGDEEEENKLKNEGKKRKEDEGGEKVRQKERRPLSDLNKAEKKPFVERDRKQQCGDLKERRPLADLNQPGGRRASISGPLQQVQYFTYFFPFFPPDFFTMLMLLMQNLHCLLLRSSFFASDPRPSTYYHLCRFALTEWSSSLELPDLVQVQVVSTSLSCPSSS